MPAFLITLAIIIILQVVAYALTPKPKQPRPEAVRDLDDPVAEAGKPIPKIWGTVTIKGLNVLWFGDKSISSYKVKV